MNISQLRSDFHALDDAKKREFLLNILDTYTQDLEHLPEFTSMYMDIEENETDYDGHFDQYFSLITESYVTNKDMGSRQGFQQIQHMIQSIHEKEIQEQDANQNIDHQIDTLL